MVLTSKNKKKSAHVKRLIRNDSATGHTGDIPVEGAGTVAAIEKIRQPFCHTAIMQPKVPATENEPRPEQKKFLSASVNSSAKTVVVLLAATEHEISVLEGRIVKRLPVCACSLAFASPSAVSKLPSFS